MVDGEESIFERRRRLLEERAQQRGESLPPPTTQPPQFDASTIPDLYTGERDETEDELDRIINGIDILSAYNKWCGKMVPDPKGKREGIMISCPIPGHQDSNPSAWINLDKQTWFCGGCQEGGDQYTIAAYHFGYPVPGYQEGANFHKLRKQMAESFGWVFKDVPGGEVIYLADHRTQEPDQTDIGLAPPTQPAEPQPEEPPEAQVAHMFADDEEPELVVYPTIDWRTIVPENTFLRAYMEATTNDDSPEEYHFWHGLVALGHAVGRHVVLDDHRPVYGNLLLCLLGNTGVGKSRSRYWLDTVIRQALPYQEDGTRTTGTKLVSVPASGEYLVSSFSYEGKDPTNNKSSLGFQSVNGIVDFDELSALLARAKREGSSLKPTIMSFADAANEVKIGSLTRGDFIAKDPFCSIIASTQPKAIRTLLHRTDTGSGFLNRWVFAGGPAKQTEVLGGSHSSTVVELDEAIRLLKEVRGWGSFDRKITLEPDAYDRYVKYFRQVLEPYKITDDTDLLKRIDLLSKKLMLLLTVNLKRETVPLQVVSSVMQIMDYAVACFGILNENIGVTLMQDIINDILRHVRRHEEKTGRGASARDLQRYLARKNYSLEHIKKALDTLCSMDMLELVKPKSGSVGRPTIRYTVVGE